MPRHTISTMIGKLVKQVARLRGSGSALPGLVVERMDRGYLRRTLEPLPGGVVLVSGTNGKTTTTKVVTELLQAVGYKVFTNRTGSNFSRGVISELLPLVNWRGRLDADIAVLELDEAWAVHFVRQVKPRMSLFLNVMRDQLDRFGEIDTAAEMLAKNAEAATEAVILNRDDPRVYRIRERTKAEAVYFGTTDELLALMPTDDTLKGGQARANHEAHADVLLTAIDGRRATYEIDGAEHVVEMSLGGVYNLINAAAALTLVRRIVGDAVPTQKLLEALGNVRPAFGRGETITYKGVPIELVLVKNPSGFRLSLLSFADGKADNMIAINDNYADGRDISWLWDVDFTPLDSVALVTGTRADGMALRLAYDDVPVGEIEADLQRALDRFAALNPGKPKRIYTTYTAMTALRKLMSGLALGQDQEAAA